MVVDKVQIYLKAGNGGEGSVSSIQLSSRKVMGGGGDGGDGGSVIVRVSPHLYDLSKFQMNMRFCAQDGGKGLGHNKKGKDGNDLVVSVPQGAIIRDLDGNIIVDLAEENQEFLACRGGRGGKGNYKRDYSIPAQDGQSKDALLDYRIPNDAVILGFANTGKTSLFNALTGKSCKVAAYPFTTTSCVWAECRRGFGKFIVLDSPPLKKSLPRVSVLVRGLPQKLSENSFLKHLYRSRAIIFISDNFAQADKEFCELENEVVRADESLLKDKKIFYLLSKIDKIDRTIKFKSKDITSISVEKDIGFAAFKQEIAAYFGV